jgi:hypothetical protein
MEPILRRISSVAKSLAKTACTHFNRPRKSQRRAQGDPETVFASGIGEAQPHGNFRNEVEGQRYAKLRQQNAGSAVLVVTPQQLFCAVAISWMKRRTKTHKDTGQLSLS